MLRTDDLDYDLPGERIATRPARPRESARLLVVSRSSPTDITHAHVRDLPRLLRSGDLLVRNTSPVLNARLRGHRSDTQGAVSGLFLEAIAPTRWRCLFKANARLRPSTRITLTHTDPSAPSLEIILDTKNDDASWNISLIDPPAKDPHELLSALGLTPLPPYILAARKQQHIDEPDEHDRNWYHTVFEDLTTIDEHGASVAAPTAGLHLSEPLINTLRDSDISIADVVLHVGEGTFKPVETDSLDDHPMHSERFLVPQHTMDAIGRTRHADGRVIALGTTTARALESTDDTALPGRWNSTSLLISPGYTFRHIDALMTNFHLPRSTLLAMVAALFSNGIDDLLPIYREAIARGYRFYSYGDAMLILP
ncbi:MAG: tRNA preQ1(34) S-adenosylmethionine ribosyltransferase-isomerase QueA [Phycisphaerales bacterium JB043]